MEWFFLCFGFFLLTVGIWAVYTTVSCKKEIVGIYIKSNAYRSAKAQSSYAPVFRYIVAGQAYEQQSLQSFSREYVQTNFECGKEYSIFVKEKNPRRFVIRQKVQISHILIILCGVLMLGIAFIGFMVN